MKPSGCNRSASLFYHVNRIDQVLIARRLSRRALALAGRLPWFAFLSLRCVLAMTSSAGDFVRFDEGKDFRDHFDDWEAKRPFAIAYRAILFIYRRKSRSTASQSP